MDKKISKLAFRTFMMLVQLIPSYFFFVSFVPSWLNSTALIFCLGVFNRSRL